MNRLNKQKDYYDFTTGLVYRIVKCRECNRDIQYFPTDKSESLCECGQNIQKKTLFKRALRFLGYGFIGLGVATLWIPLPTSTPSFIIGGFCLGLSKKEILKRIDIEKRGLKTGSTLRYLKQKCLLIKANFYKLTGSY